LDIDVFSKIKLLILDVDGVFTNGILFLNSEGEEIKGFSTRDGLGIAMLIRAGVEVVMVTGRYSKTARIRANELGIKNVYEKTVFKGPICRQIISDRNLTKDQVCAMGDDIIDLAMFSEVGLKTAPADAVQEIISAADWVSSMPGGKGAIRELCELILKSKNLWEDSINFYINGGFDRNIPYKF